MATPTTVDYGRDTSCTTSRRTGRLASGRVLLGEAAYRRITTPRGMLRGGEEEESYGIDILSLVGASNPRAVAARLPGQIRDEILKDERFTDATAIVTTVQNGPAFEFLISIEIESSEGPFTLKIGVNEVSAELLGVVEG